MRSIVLGIKFSFFQGGVIESRIFEILEGLQVGGFLGSVEYGGVEFYCLGIGQELCKGFLGLVFEFGVRLFFFYRDRGMLFEFSGCRRKARFRVVGFRENFVVFVYWVFVLYRLV